MKLQSSCANCFAGLSCQTRLQILSLLQEKGALSVLEIAKHFQVTQPTITHHLTYLKKVGILTSERQGKKNYLFSSPQMR